MNARTVKPQKSGNGLRWCLWCLAGAAFLLSQKLLLLDEKLPAGFLAAVLSLAAAGLLWQAARAEAPEWFFRAAGFLSLAALAAVWQEPFLGQGWQAVRNVFWRPWAGVISGLGRLPALLAAVLRLAPSALPAVLPVTGLAVWLACPPRPRLAAAFGLLAAALAVVALAIATFPTFLWPWAGALGVICLAAVLGVNLPAGQAATKNAAPVPMLRRPGQTFQRLAYLGLGGLFVLVLLGNAWVSEDAYITFRTVDNFIHGLGLTWNIAERVQAYTHPLWMLLMSSAYFFTRDVYSTSLALGLLLSLGAFFIFVFKIAPSLPTAAVGTALLCLSKAFVDYSTSGLENSLAYFLLAVFFVLHVSAVQNARTFWLLCLTLALILLTRLDLACLLLPLWAWRCWPWARRHPGRALALAIAGWAPFWLWEVFSFAYYGFWFPNTAYAKLATGMAWTQAVQQGWHYFQNSLAWDPLTPGLIALAAVAASASRRSGDRFLAAGLGLYLFYILSIGGDFMSGRFLAAPFLLGVLWLLHRLRLTPARAALALLALAGLHLATPLNPLHTRADYEHKKFDTAGIADERGYYFQETGLCNARPELDFPRHPWKSEGLILRAVGTKLAVYGNIGLAGFYAGPRTHIIDVYGLADPLLARLPAKPGCRIGHFERELPAGYVETWKYRQNLLQDKRLAEYYDRLCNITQGPLFRLSRWKDMVNMNLGLYDGLLSEYTRQEP